MKRWMQASLGIGAALALSEAAARVRDHNAFSHLRCYLPDPELGLRLEPGRDERIEFGGAPVTHVHINSDGLRGPESPPADNEVLVVGDSQVFGLGVEETQTFSSLLANQLRRPVLNAGVPTYGPLEYATMVDRMLSKRSGIKTVVLMISFQNDFFEANKPNLERHASWDGWAVRKEHAPSSVTWFPGRTWLYRDSHLFYALRRWRYGNDAEHEPERVASGGDVSQLIDLSARERDTPQRNESWEQLRETLGRELLVMNKSGERSDESALALAPDESMTGELAAFKARPHLLSASADGKPGDILASPRLGEGEVSYSLKLTAEVIAKASALRATLYRRWDELHGAGGAREVAAVRKQLNALIAISSPIAAPIAKIAARCRQSNARLVIVGMPMDVMVSPTAFAKYNTPPQDMQATEQLSRDLNAISEQHGALYASLLRPLQSAQEEPFLPREFHMSPAGHRTAAYVLRKMIQQTEVKALTLDTARPSRVRMQAGAPSPTGDTSELVSDALSVDVEGRLVIKHMRQVSFNCAPASTLSAATHMNLAVAKLDLPAGESCPLQYRQLWPTPNTRIYQVSRIDADTYEISRSWIDVGDMPAPIASSVSAEFELLRAAIRLLNVRRRVEPEPGRDKFVQLQRVDSELDGERGCLHAHLPQSFIDVLRNRKDLEDTPLRGSDKATETDPLLYKQMSTSELEQRIGTLLRCLDGDPRDVPPCEEGAQRVGPAKQCSRLCDAQHLCGEQMRCLPYRGTGVCTPVPGYTPDELRGE